MKRKLVMDKDLVIRAYYRADKVDEIIEAVRALFVAAEPGLLDARFPEEAALLRSLIDVDG